VSGDGGNTPFGAPYAAIYDATYANKDYERECDVLEEAFARHSEGEVRAILDLGCGSGGHLLPLARRGYELVGVDRSPSMLDVAREKLAEAKLVAELRHGDARSVRLGRTFDAALLMFAVLGYQRTNEDVLATLRTARAHLRTGGLLCLDVWYGPAVLTTKPEQRRRTVSTPNGSVERSASAELDIRRHLCTVRYRLAGPSAKAQAVEEEHVVRFFFPMELELFLTDAGLELLSLTRFGSLDEEADENTWNVFVVARAP
jgi:SAM-dependent methyltransferase